MGYKLGFNGDVTAELERLLQSIEKGLNGYGIHADASVTAASTVTGPPEPPCPPGQTCTDGAKIGHDAIVVAVAVVGGGLAGYIAGKLAAQREIARLKN